MISFDVCLRQISRIDQTVTSTSGWRLWSASRNTTERLRPAMGGVPGRYPLWPASQWSSGYSSKIVL